MKVTDLETVYAIRTTIVLSHPSDPENVIYYASKSHTGRREQNEDGSYPAPITSASEEKPGEQQLKAGVNISKYTLKDGKHTIEEVLERPKRRAISEDMGPSYTAEDATIAETESITDFQYWDEFQTEYGDYESISSDKNINFDYV